MFTDRLTITGGTISRREYLIINVNRADIGYKRISEIYNHKLRSGTDRLRVTTQ